MALNGFPPPHSMRETRNFKLAMAGIIAFFIAIHPHTIKYAKRLLQHPVTVSQSLDGIVTSRCEDFRGTSHYVHAEDGRSYRVQGPYDISFADGQAVSIVVDGPTGAAPFARWEPYYCGPSEEGQFDLGRNARLMPR